MNDDTIRACVAMTYSFLCGYAVADVELGGDGYVRPETFRDLEQTLLNLGMTEKQVAQARDSALAGATSPAAGES